MTSLSIKAVVKDDGPEMRWKGDHVVIVPPYQHLACWHCGYWLSPFPRSSSYGISFRMYSAIMKAFQADHRSCKPQSGGRESYIELNREWDQFMRENHKQREEWEKDRDTKWAPSDWGAKYDEWINLPFHKKERKKI